MTEIWTAIIGAAAIIAVAIIGWMQAVTLKRVTMAEQARRDGQERMGIVLMCVSACLNGVHQLGANGPVTEALNALDEYKNKKSAA